MKKVTALLLAIVMVLGLGTMASASAPADRVQINNMMVDASLRLIPALIPALLQSRTSLWIGRILR